MNRSLLNYLKAMLISNKPVPVMHSESRILNVNSYRPHMVLAAVTALLLSSAANTSAITTPACTNNKIIIDDLSTTSSTAYILAGNTSTSLTSAGDGILGGERDITMTLAASSTSNIGNAVQVGSGAYAASVGASAIITDLTVTYDGIDGVAGGVNTTPGLGNINMYGLDSFKANLKLDGIASGKSATVKFKVYSDATHWSESSITFTGPVANPTYNIAIPRSAFVPGSGSAGPADFTSVDAVQLNFSSDQNGVDVSFDGITVPCSGYPINGNVYYDANGLVDHTVNGTGINVGGSLIAVLYDLTTGKVAGSSDVAPDGSYRVDGVDGHNYSVYLTTTPAIVGQTATPTITLPSGWVSTGENLGVVAGDDGSVNSILPIGVLSATVTNANFGIEQPPTATAKSFSVTPGAFAGTPPTGYPTVAGYVSIPSSSTRLTGYSGTGGALAGTDPEDCAGANGCTIGKTFTIGSLNSNTLLYYDFGSGPVLLTSNSTIENYDPTKLVIYGQAGSGNAVAPIGFTYSITDAAGTTSPFVPYALTSTTPLPVALLSFTGVSSGCKAILHWETANEKQLTRFEVESGKDGNFFTRLATTEASNSTTGSKYDLEISQESGIAYYRLKMMDLDGAYKYSTIVVVQTNCKIGTIRLFPNPATDQVTISGLKGGEQFTITDLAGRVMLTDKRMVNNHLSVSDLPVGSYFLRIISGEPPVSTIKFLKQ